MREKKKYLFVYTFFCNCEKDEKTTNLVMTSSHTFPRTLCTQLNIKELQAFPAFQKQSIPMNPFVS